MAAEYTRRYVDITSIRDDDEEETERFSEEDRARMARAAAEMAAELHCDEKQDNDDGGGMSDVD